MKISIDPKKELFRWGPIDGKLIYTDFFNIAFALYPKYFTGWPDVLWLGVKEKITCILDNHNLYEGGRKNFLRYIMVDREFKKNLASWRKNLKRLLARQKGITAISLKKLSNSELAKEYSAWVKAYLDFWTIGELPEIANWGGEIILREKLEKILPADDFIRVFERLAAPEALSFYQKAELDLLKIKNFSRRQKLFEKKMVDYQKRYFWILNNYHHAKVLSVSYFKKELLSYSLPALKNKIKQWENLPAKVKKEKAAIIKKYKLNKDIAKIAKRLSYCVWWQDLRKYYIFLANYYISLFLLEFSRRYKISFSDLANYNVSETLDLARKQKRVPAEEVKQRKINLAVHYSEKSNSLRYFSGAKARKIIAIYTLTKVDKSVKVIKGLVVSRGELVKGRVRVLKSISDFGKMKNGEILVAAMTTPDYIVAIKKAKAIITDEGGMTCHAAIVSRELKIPCIVGTKIATKVLKDGDLVEVDANQGIVKKI